MKEKKRYAGWFIMAGVVLLTLLGLGRYGFTYLNTLVFTERQSQLKEVVSPYFTKIDTMTDGLWQTASALENRVLAQKPADAESLQALFAQEYAIQNWEEQGISPIAIRADGQYLDANGVHGSLGYTDPLSDCETRTSFIYEQPMTGTLLSLYVYRLEEPMEIQSENNVYSIAFVGISRKMESMNQYFKCSAYGNDNSTYILDRYGAKQYVDSSASMNLIEGHNVYGVLRQEYEAQDRDFDAVLEELDKNGTAYSDVEIGGEQCFYAMRKMPNTDYVILYINPADRVATSTAALVNLVVRVFLLVAIGILLMIIAVTATLFARNRKQLAFETQSKLKLQELNDELDEANIELQKASKAKSDFLANMSHDIRTPMNAIVGITDLMAHEPDTSDKMHTYIEKVKLSSRHLLSLINDILDMSKIEASEVTLNEEPVSLAEQVGQVDSIIRSQTNERAQTFNILVHTITHEYLIGDSVRLRQIFLNLLSNAVKYTPAGGTVSFILSELPCDIPEHATIRVTVEDDGYGMAPEFVEHIFEPFTRAEDSVTNKVQGTGLGMAITKNIVDLMGGTITVQSELGKGTRFEVTLTLPINEGAQYAVPAKRILLISDEDTLIENMEASMKESGADFYIAKTQEEAVALLQKNGADVILLSGHLYDQELSDMVHLLRETEKDAALIFCCDYAQMEQVYDILTSSGVDGLVARPFFLSNLSRAIAQIRKDGSTAAEQRSTVLEGKRFLCAEDNDLNAEILEAVLEMKNASCTICPNGEELLKVFAEVKPGDYDAILMDVQMPVMNGLDASKAIRDGANPLGRTIPIIAMTANAFTEDVQQCLDAGMDAHVSKPLDISTLERTLRSILNENFRGGGTPVRRRKTVKSRTGCRE